MSDVLQAKADRLAEKFNFIKKITPKIPKIMDDFSNLLTLEGSGRRRKDTKSTLGIFFLLIWGKTVQTNYVDGRWHQIKAYTSPKLFLQTDKEISENRNFLLFGPLLGNDERY